jgi:hypothetical protein
MPEVRLGYYRDIAVLAFPTPASERESLPAEYAPKVTTSVSTQVESKLTDGDVNSFVSLPGATPKAHNGCKWK